VKFALLFVVFAFASAISPAERQHGYKLQKDIPIGGEGGWDYLSIDAAARRLYVAHASKIMVVDLDSNKVVGQIDDTRGVHGIAIAPELSLGFSSNGAEARVSVIDLKTFKTIAKVGTGENPDAILYDPARSEVYAFNGRGKSVTVIDAKTNKSTATVPLSGKPEFAALDGKSGRVFCNIEDKNEVAVIDTKKHTVITTWPLAPGEEPTGMAFDATHHRLFIGCHNKLMAMLDSDSGKVILTMPIGAGVDACAFDEVTQFAFASCGDGTVTIAKEEKPDALKVMQTIATERGARTMALDPKTHRIYTASAQIAPAESTPAGGQPVRPNYVPGTFHVLVYGTDL
jgi:YVTN family beta-propeller protein